MIIIYVYVEAQYPVALKKKMFVAFISQFNLATSIYFPVKDEWDVPGNYLLWLSKYLNLFAY